MKLAAMFVLCGLTSIAAAQAPGDPAPPPPPPAGYPPPPPPAAYPPPAPGYGPAYGVADAGKHRHDGFYLRMFLGAAYTSMELEDADTKLSGAGGAFGIALGFAVSDNLIVFGELFDDIAVEPTVEMGGSSAEARNVNAGVVAVGAGVAYYFMPANIYVSGTLSWGQLTAQDEDNNEIAETDFGPGLSLMVGKEWWVSDNWGLGGALQIYGGRQKEKDIDATWNTAAVALTFSATYN